MNVEFKTYKHWVNDTYRQTVKTRWLFVLVAPINYMILRIASSKTVYGDL